MTPALRAWLGWAPAILWFALIFVLSSQPTLPSPDQVTDKQAHAFAYGVLAVLCLMGLTGWRWRRVAGASLLGVADVVADAAGAALALTAAWCWAILVGRRSSMPRS